MSAKELTAMRTSFNKGDKVMVSRRRYANHEAALYEATILDIHSTHAVVKYTDQQRSGRNREVVQFKKLLRVADEAEVAPKPASVAKPEPKPLELRAVPPAFDQLKLVRPVEPEDEELEENWAADNDEPEEEPPTPAARYMAPEPKISELKSKALDDVSAWLEMGSSLKDLIAGKIKELRMLAEHCDSEAQKLVEEADKRRAEADALAKKLQKLELIAEL